jgi:uncharacterized membrane protein
MRLKSPDLLFAAIIVGLTLVVALARIRSGNIEYETMPFWMAPVGILMVLFIPGYCIVTGILPAIGSEKTLLLSLGISASISVVGGIILNLTPWGLTPATWSLLLSLIAVIGIILSWRQRRDHARNFETGVPSLQKEHVVIFGWAGLILVSSVLIAYFSSKQTETTYSQLWAIPSATAEGHYEIQIGIRNEEMQPEVYDLYMDINGRLLNEWSAISLEPGKEWITTVELLEQPSQPIQISLYRNDDGSNVYRWLHLSPEAFK